MSNEIVLDEFGTTMSFSSMKNWRNILSQDRSEPVGRHQITDKNFFMVPRSNTHFCIIHEDFGQIGDPIPYSVKTYIELKNWCDRKIKEKQAKEGCLADIQKKLKSLETLVGLLEMRI